MAAKVLNIFLVAVGVLVLGVIALIGVYVIGYSLFALFGHAGMGSGAARGVGAGIAAVIAIVVLGLYFRSRRAAAQSSHNTQHPHRHRAA